MRSSFLNDLALNDLEMFGEAPVRREAIDSLDPRHRRTDPQFVGKHLQHLEVPSRVNLDRPVRAVPYGTA